MIDRFRAARRDPELAVLEGLHALKHALRFGARVLEAHAPDPDALAALAERLAPDVADDIARLTRPLDPATFARLAPSPHPTGVIALARRPAVDPAAALRDAAPSPLVLLDRPTHHGNIGAVVRVAAAAGAAGVLTTGPHDPWHPASIRGGAGLQFALPVARIDRLPACDRPLVALDPDGESWPGEPGAAGAIPQRAVLIFGSERGGVSPELLARVARRIRIPMRPGVSSLNLATSVAAVLYSRHPGAA